MFEWLLITNDPYLTERWSMIETLVLFVAVMMGLMWTGKYYIFRLRNTWSENLAKSFGYQDFNEFWYEFIREMQMATVTFLMGTASIYTFMHKEEVTQTYECLAYASGYEYCAKMNKTLACVAQTKNPWEVGSILNSLNGSFGTHREPVNGTGEPG